MKHFNKAFAASTLAVLTGMGVFTGSAFAATPIEASIQQITGEVRLIIKRELPSGEINYEKRMVPADEAETREALLLQDPSVLLVERDTLAFSPIPMVSPIPATSQALLDGVTRWITATPIISINHISRPMKPTTLG